MIPAFLFLYKTKADIQRVQIIFDQYLVAKGSSLDGTDIILSMECNANKKNAICILFTYYDWECAEKKKYC